MQMIYLLHTQPDEELARRLRERFSSVFGARRPHSKPLRERPAFDAPFSMEEILEDLHYGRAA